MHLLALTLALLQADHLWQKCFSVGDDLYKYSPVHLLLFAEVNLARQVKISETPLQYHCFLQGFRLASCRLVIWVFQTQHADLWILSRK